MKKNILILDDQVMYGRSLARALGREYDVRHAVSCLDAKARAEYVHIALVDIRLDEEADAENREGLDFIRWLRKQSRDVSIIAMSALEE
ncbi:MAG: response regulator [Desulfobacteraceae bacterium]|nr:response regulator [Desulfobacteraceae bacterium]